MYLFAREWPNLEHEINEDPMAEGFPLQRERNAQGDDNVSALPMVLEQFQFILTEAESIGRAVRMRKREASGR